MEEEQKGQEEENTAVMGGFSAQLRYSNPYVYDQFSVQTTEQKINQIILLQVGICSKTVQSQPKWDKCHQNRQKQTKSKVVRSLIHGHFHHKLMFCTSYRM